MTVHRKALSAAAAIALVLWLDAPPAVADRIVRGVVVKLEAGEIYVDVGAASGATAGAPVRLKRLLRVHHPVSKKPVEDLLPIGESTVKEVGRALSVIVPEPELARQIAPGDVVEVYVVERVARPRRPPRARPAPRRAPRAPLPEVPPEQAERLHLWKQVAGRSLDERIVIAETWLAEHPRSPSAALVRQELAGLQAARDAVTASPDRPVTEASIEGIAHAAPTRAEHRRPLLLAFLVSEPDRVRGAWLHHRRHGSETFRRAPLRRDGDGYLRADLRGEDVEAPGVEYFVEVATGDGAVGAAVGTPLRPIAVEVAAPSVSTLFRARESRSRVSLRTTFMDYATFDRREGDGTTRDRQLLVEADFLYRLRAALYGIRVGFGALHGVGGYKDPAPRSEANGFTYGYVEAELRREQAIAFMGRAVAGLGEDGLGFGVEGRIRLGDEDDTNLTFAGSTIEDVGFLSELHLQWAVFPRFPLGFGVALTDQPNNGDLGVRFSVDVGVKVLRWIQPTVRVSYQGRSKAHSGLGTGLGLVFDW